MSALDPSQIRDLPNTGMPLPGLLTAGQPSRAQIDALAAPGVRTVIDLRPAAEDHGFDEPDAVRGAGMAYRRIPVTDDALDAAAFDAVRAVLRAVLPDASAAPALLHCASANRVGAVLIPYLVLDAGRTPDDALRVAREVGLRSDDLARRAFAYVAEHGPGDASPR